MEGSEKKKEEEEKCLQDMIQGTTEEAKIGEFKKKAQEALSKLAEGIEKATDDYREKRSEMLQKWNAQEECISKLKSQLETCYPKLDDILKCAVCAPKLEAKKLKNVWECNLGLPELCYERAAADKKRAEEELEAWKTIATWIAERLKKIDDLIKEFCALDNCKESHFRLYILFCEIIPYHKSLKKGEVIECVKCDDCGDADLPCCKELKECLDKELAKLDKVEFCGLPWFIEPKKLDCKVAEAWKAWSKAGEAEALADCKRQAVKTSKEAYEKASKDETIRKTVKALIEECVKTKQPTTPSDDSSGCQSS